LGEHVIAVTLQDAKRDASRYTFIIKLHLLAQRLPDALGEDPQDLTIREQRIDNAAAVIDCEKADQARIARLHVDLDHRAVRPERVAPITREVGFRGEAWLHPLRQPLAIGGGRSQRSPRERSPWDPRHAYRSADKDDVFAIGFEQVRCQVARFMTHLLSSLVHGRAAM